MSGLMAKLEQNRGKQAAAMKAAAAQRGAGGRDTRFWKWSGVSVDKLTDKGKPQQHSYSRIRLLPICFADIKRSEEGVLAEHQVLSPIVTVMKHNFKIKSTGKWYSEMSLGMLGQDCPVNEHDRPLWSAWKDDGKPDNDVKKTLVERIAKDKVICNILVIDDRAKPENNGKVFLFEVPRAVLSMIDEAIEPSKPAVDPIDPYDYLEGHDLILDFMMPKQKFGDWEGFAAKDIGTDSYFEKSKTPIADNEADIERIMSEAYSLTEFTDLKHFKTYDELKKRFYDVMGFEAPAEDQQAQERAQQSVQSNQGAVDNSSAPTQTVTTDASGIQQDTAAEQQSAPTQTTQDTLGGGVDELSELEAMLQADS